MKDTWQSLSQSARISLTLSLILPGSSRQPHGPLRVPRSSQVSDKVPRNSRTCQGSRAQKLLCKLPHLLAASVSSALGAMLWTWWLYGPTERDRTSIYMTYKQIPCLPNQKLKSSFFFMKRVHAGGGQIARQPVMNSEWLIRIHLVEIETMELNLWDTSKSFH